jgi:hypothetical protein
MEFFKQYFHNVNFEGKRGEVKVLCPFHSDTKPSATVNAEKSLFHCWVCDSGYNEEQFMAKVKDIPVTQAIKLLSEMSNHVGVDWEISRKAELWADDEMLKALSDMGFEKEFVEEMNLGMAYVNEHKTLAIPIFFDGVLMDVRKYNLLRAPNLAKMTSEKGAKSGWIFPYDIWKNSTDTTYIFEGEKDAMCARQEGLNAISLTGGAGADPNEFVLPAFRGRDVIICYDNDKAGHDGSQKLANTLYGIAKTVSTVDIGLVVKEDKEDFYDYIRKYNGDIYEFLSLPVTPFIKVEKPKTYTKINHAMGASTLNKELRTLVTVTSEFVEAYKVPTVIQATKVSAIGSDKKDTLDVGDKRSWVLEDHNLDDMLSLIEVEAKDRNVRQRAMELVKLPPTEYGIDLEFKSERFVYRCMVTDKDPDGHSITLDLYSFDKLQVGGQYEITHRLFAHPTKNQRIVAIATEAVPTDAIKTMGLDKGLLSLFVSSGPIKDRVERLYQSAKHHIAQHLDFNIWLMSDLVFSSILDFKYGEVMRGALDVFMLGDTQVGKSETTSRLVDLYSFGHFLSLKTSTTVGLIGGSNKVEGSWVNTIGAIPRQHRKLVVLEEFSGAPMDFIKTMTVVRSSNEIWLTRASGELRAPCKLRMITISNPLNDNNGNPRFMSSFPNGVITIMELVKSAEDVSRYDGFILTPKKDNRFNPFENHLVGEPIPKDAYQTKAQWVYTRGVEDVVFEPGVESYIWQKAEYLNSLFECNVPIFGTTTSKKLARFAVALASLILNTDATMEKVIVTKEIVDYVAEFLEGVYKAPQFKLDVVKREWESYNAYSEKDVKVAEDLYPANTTMFEFLGNQSKTTRANLQAVSGLDRDAFSVVFNTLVMYRFVRIDMENVYPTEKFRKVNSVMRKLSGELVSKHGDPSLDF